VGEGGGFAHHLIAAGARVLWARGRFDYEKKPLKAISGFFFMWRLASELSRTPNLLRRLNHQPQLGALGFHRNVVAMHGAAEAALG
jgi:hypothetical protein